MEMDFSGSYKLFYSVFNANPYPGAITPVSNDRILIANKAFGELVGCGPDQLTGKTLSETGILKNAEERDILFEKMKKEGSVRNYETSFNISSEETRDFIISIEKIEYEGERRLISTVIDITDKKRTERYLRLLEKAIRTSKTGFTICDTDGLIKFTNPADARMHGYSPEELIGKNVGIYSPPEKRKQLAEKQLRSMTGWVRESINLRKDGSCFPVRLISDMVRDEDGEPIGVITTCEDITERRQMEDRLKKSNEELELLVRERTGELVKVNEELRREIEEHRKSVEILQKLSCAVEQSPSIAMITDSKGIIEYVNPKFSHVTGYKAEEVIGADIYDLCGSSENYSFNDLMKAVLSGAQWRGELCNSRKNGDIFWELSSFSPIKNDSGEIVNILKLAEEITGLKVSEEKRKHQALYDALTDLPNRVLFFDRLKHAYERMQRQDDLLFAVLLLDIDRFKIINDSLGHSVGDQLLKGVGRRLSSCLRAGDTVGRLGGDEFGLLIENIEDVSDATRVAERIHKELEVPFEVDEHEIIVTASIGIAFNSKDYRNHQDIMRDADTAMYRAKARGKGSHDIFDEDMHNYAMNLLQLESDLRRAVRRNEFCVFFQPMVCLSSGRIIGAETLIRWQHPRRGLVYPNDFIPLAEETGLITDLSEYVFREAASQCKILKDKGLEEFVISVNCSVRQLKQHDLLSLIREILNHYDISPGMFELEVTESIAMDDSANNILKELSNVGVRISIDDFGTGYSSLSRLKSFPINSLKIDRSFVKDINVDADAEDITSAIIAVADKLDLFLIAEGVENYGQMEILRSLKCNAAQGYLFAKPMPVEDFINLMAGDISQYESVINNSLHKELDNIIE